VLPITGLKNEVVGVDVTAGKKSVRLAVSPDQELTLTLSTALGNEIG
jgi:hypothetical protein